MRTIRSSREIDGLFREGARVSHPVTIALIGKTPIERGPEGRVGFVAGKKLGNAVLRNRSKRVMRAAVMRSGGPWSGADVLLVARPGTASAVPSDLDAAMREITRRIGCLP